jgi:ribosomal protein L40E
MTDDEDCGMKEGTRELLEKSRIPHKFCPYCGTKNEGDAETCVNCDKDISWMKVPERRSAYEAPILKPRKMPKQREPFNWRQLIIVLLILLLVAALIVTLWATLLRGSELGGGLDPDDVGSLLQPGYTAGLVASPIRSRPNLQPLLAL